MISVGVRSVTCASRHCGPRIAVVEQTLQRTPAAPLQGALHRGEVLVDVGLEDRTPAAAQLGHGGQGRRRRRFGDRHRQRRVDQVVPLQRSRWACARASTASWGSVPPSGRRSLQIMPRTQRIPASPAASGDHADVRFHAGAGVADGGEAAPQRFSAASLAGQIGGLLVQAGLEGHPHSPEDLGRLTENQRLAERLGQVMMRVHEARHQERLVQPQPG